MVYPIEVEKCLLTHSDIAEVISFALPNNKEDDVCAWIKLKQNSNLTLDQVRQFCSERLRAHQVPKYVLFKDFFPQNSMGKYSRKEMAQICQNELLFQTK